jgi:hypothetical protein
MELLVVLLIVVVLALFDWLSLRFGVDSRDDITAPPQGFVGDSR